MTTLVKDIVPVSFSIGTPIYSTEAAFSIPLLMAEITDTDTRIQTFTSLSSVLTSYAATTDVGIWATDFFSQTSKGGKKPSILKVGKKLTDANCVQNVVFDADASAGTFTLSLGGVASSAIAYDAATAAVETAIESIAALTSVTVALNTGGTQAGDKEGFLLLLTVQTPQQTLQSWLQM